MKCPEDKGSDHVRLPKQRFDCRPPLRQPGRDGQDHLSSLLGSPNTSLDWPDPRLLRCSHLSCHYPCLEAIGSPAPGPRMLQGFPEG